MNDKFVILPALIGPTSPIYYFFVDENGHAFRVADLATDERTKLEEKNRLVNLMRDAVIRQLEARSSNLNQFPYATRPVSYRQIVNRTYDINGVKITLRGDEPSIRAALNVLRTYPPKGPVYLTDDGKENFLDLSNFICPDSTSVPPVGYEKNRPNDSIITIIMPDKQKFNGSGSLLLVTDRDLVAPIDYTKIFIPLFRDVESGNYASLGGRIDEPDGSSDKELSLNILYNNARRESREESADLIQISSDNQLNDSTRQFIDIDSLEPSILYRSYIRYVKISATLSLDKFKTMYVQNSSKVRRDANFGPAYLETDNLELLSVASLMTRTLEIMRTTDVSKLDYEYYMTNTSMPIKVRGRTIRVLAKLFEGTPGSRKIDTFLNTPQEFKYSFDAGMHHMNI